MHRCLLTSSKKQLAKTLSRAIHSTRHLAMPAVKIDGNAIAKSIREQISEKIANTQARNPKFQPSLAIIQVGERPDSTSYVSMKQKAAVDAKIEFKHIKLPEDISEAAVRLIRLDLCNTNVLSCSARSTS